MTVQVPSLPSNTSSNYLQNNSAQHVSSQESFWHTYCNLSVRAESFFLFKMKSNLAYICFAVSCYFAVSTDVQSSMRTWNITEDCKPITIQCHTLYRNFSHEYAPPNNCTCFDADAICEGEKDVCVNGSKLCPPTKYPKIYVLEIVRNPLFGNFSSSATPYIISCTTAMEKHCPASAQHRLSCLQVNETIERVYLSRCSSACNNPLALISLNKVQARQASVGVRITKPA